MVRFLVYAIFINVAILQVLSQTCSNCNETCKTNPGLGGKPGNPGAKYRLNGKMVDLADQVVSNRMTHLIKNLTTPDIKYVDLVINNLKVSDLKDAKFNRKLDPLLSNIKWGFVNSTLVIKGNFSQTNKSPAKGSNNTDKNVTGIITITSYSTSMDTTILQSRDIENRPIIASIICTTNVKNTNITFDPEINITEITRSDIIRQIENSMERLICSSATDKLKDFFNKNVLQSYPTKFNLSTNGLTLDYGLTDNLKFTKNNSAVEGLLKGTVYVRFASGFPFFPPDIEEKNASTDSNWEFFMTSYVLNTFFYVSHQDKLLNFTAIPKYMSNASADLLSTSCGSGNCVGAIYTNLSSFGPQAYVTLSIITTTEYPKVSFNSSLAYMIMPKAKIEMKIVNDTKTTNLFSAISSCIYANLTPKVSQNTVYFVSNITFLDLNSIESPSKNISSNEDISKLQNIIMKVLEELLNGFLSVGFPIPLVKGVSLVSPKLELLPGTIYIYDNPSFVPETYRSKP